MLNLSSPDSSYFKGDYFLACSYFLYLSKPLLDCTWSSSYFRWRYSPFYEYVYIKTSTYNNLRISHFTLFYLASKVTQRCQLHFLNTLLLILLQLMLLLQLLLKSIWVGISTHLIAICCCWRCKLLVVV